MSSIDSPRIQSADARQWHFGEFYGLRQTERRGPTILVHGNCQAGSVRRLLETAGANAMRVPPVHELTASDITHLRRALSRTEVLVSQPVAPGYRGLPVGTEELQALLPDTSILTLFPVLRFAGLFPFQVTVRPAAASSVDPPLMPYHDLRTLLVADDIRSGRIDAGDALTRISKLTNMVGTEEVRKVAKASIDQMRLREVVFGAVGISEVLRKTSHEFQTHHTLNHPTNRFFEEVAAVLVEELTQRGVQGLDPAPVAPPEEMLGGIGGRIEAVVAAEFPVTPKPWRVGARELSDEEVYASQLSWYADNPLFVDEGLTRHADTVSLLGLR